MTGAPLRIRRCSAVRIAVRLRLHLLLSGTCFGLALAAGTTAVAAIATVPDQFAAHPYAPHVAEASQRFGIPELWIWAVMRAESRGNSRAVSPAGAIGLMQIMPGTWSMLSAGHGLGSDPFDARANILGGAAYLRAMWDRYRDVSLMLAAYNAGPGRADDYAAGRRRLPAETVNYVAQIAPRLGMASVALPAAMPPATAHPWRQIARRTLLQSLNVRPVLDDAGVETGMFEVPAGGRRYRALELLVKQKRLASSALVPCIVKAASSAISAEEDSYAENAVREQLHPLDQFRAMQAMVDKGSAAEDIAAHFGVTPAVVRQRLKLASVSPRLCEIYADDGMSLEQLMAFTVCEDHTRQEQVWEMLAHSFNKSAAYIRQRLTENSVRVADKRVRFVTVEAYVAAGGGVMRDLFEDDDGGWLTDPALLDTLVAEKLRQAGDAIAAEGWKWVATAVDMPWAVTNGHREIIGTEVPMTDAEQARLAALQGETEQIEAQWAEERDVPQDVYDRLDALNAEIGKLSDRPLEFDPTDVALAGVFVSIERDGSLCIERGYVRPEDEAAPDPAPGAIEHEPGRVDGDVLTNNPVSPDHNGACMADDDDEADEGLKPLPDRLVADLTAWRTLALQDALAQSAATAFAAVLHALVLQTCYFASRESCLQIAVQDVSFANPPSGLRDSVPARSLAERARYWEERLPQSDADLWEALLALDGEDQAALFAHCASLAVNAQCEIVPKYDNGRVSKHSIERRIAHSHVLARAVGLDPVAAGWRPTVEGYFRSVTKPRILADVAEARGEQFAGMIDHLKKGDMAREAERLLEDAQWLPEPLRTPPALEPEAADAGNDALPAFLEEDDSAYAIAAE